MGLFRFVLSLIVLQSHVINKADLHWGIVAACIFMVLSGQAAEGSFARWRRISPRPAQQFLMDRAFRLVPLYWLSVLLIWICLLHREDLERGSVENLAFNLAMLGNNFVYLKQIAPALDLSPLQLWNVPTWYLAAEFQFYLLLPLFLALSPRGLRIAFALATASFLGNMMLGGPLEWSYTFATGNLAYYLGGMLLARREDPGNDRVLLAAALAALLVQLVILAASPVGYRISMDGLILGFVLGLVLVPAALRVPAGHLLPESADRWLGRLAWPVFLLHNPALFLLDEAHRLWPGLFPQLAGDVPTLLRVIVLTLALSALASLAIETPLAGWRRRRAEAAAQTREAQLRR